MKTLSNTFIVAAIVSQFAAIDAKALTYSLDDGTPEGVLGVDGPGSVTFANQFTALPGGNRIQNIEVYWNQFPAAFTARLWSDPNNDGNPSDAVELAASLVSTTDASGGFATYDIPDVDLLVGQSFFVGGTYSQEMTKYAVGLDSTDPILNQSWFQVSTDFEVKPDKSGPRNLGTMFGNDGFYWMVRANGVPADVPDGGSTIALLGLAMSAVAGARRKFGI